MKYETRITGTTRFFEDECRVAVRMYTNEAERLWLIYDELQAPPAESQYEGKTIW